MIKKDQLARWLWFLLPFMTIFIVWWMPYIRVICAARFGVPLGKKFFIQELHEHSRSGGVFKGVEIGDIPNRIKGIELIKVEESDGDVFASVLKLNQSGSSFRVWKIVGENICIIADEDDKVIEIRILTGG